MPCMSRCLCEVIRTRSYDFDLNVVDPATEPGQFPTSADTVGIGDRAPGRYCSVK